MPEAGDDRIEKVRSNPKTKRVFTHADNVVKGLAPEMREHWIDGCLAPEKVLNGRKGRWIDDPGRCMRIAAALAQTGDIAKRGGNVRHACAVQRNCDGSAWNGSSRNRRTRSSAVRAAQCGQEGCSAVTSHHEARRARLTGAMLVGDRAHARNRRHASGLAIIALTIMPFNRTSHPPPPGRDVSDHVMRTTIERFA